MHDLRVHHRVLLSALRVAAAAGTLLAAATALGAEPPPPSERPCIEPGREKEVVALFSPIALGGEVSDGFTLSGLSIDRFAIVATLGGPDGAEATVRLTAIDGGDGASASFAAQVSGSPKAAPAVESLLARLKANDAGGFWRKTCRTGRGQTPRDGPRDTVAEDAPAREPPALVAPALPEPPSPWWLAALALLLIVGVTGAGSARSRWSAAFTEVRPWHLAALAGVIGATVTLRLVLPEVPWPPCGSSASEYGRWGGPAVAALHAAGAGETLGLVLASLICAAVFLLGVVLVPSRPTTALMAAGFWAILPLGIVTATAPGIPALAPLAGVVAIAVASVDPSWRGRVAAVAWLAIATMARPEYAVLLGPLALAGDREDVWAVPVAVVAAATGWVLAWPATGLGDRFTELGALGPSLTFWMPALALLGVFYSRLSRRGRWMLVAWFAALAPVLLAPPLEAPLGRAPHVLALVIPAVLLAAGPVDRLLQGERTRGLAVAILVLAAASPWLHRATMRAVPEGFDELRLARERGLPQVPAGAQLVVVPGAEPEASGICCPNVLDEVAGRAAARDIEVTAWYGVGSPPDAPGTWLLLGGACTADGQTDRAPCAAVLRQEGARVVDQWHVRAPAGPCGSSGGAEATEQLVRLVNLDRPATPP